MNKMVSIIMPAHNAAVTIGDSIESVIKQFPDKIINFFTFPARYFKAGESQNFLFNQCTYYPKRIAKQLAKVMREVKEEYAKSHNRLQYDVLEDMALRIMGLTHIQYRPCLVQHLDGKSLIGNRDSGRMTIYFIDYLDELNISYEEANEQKNVLKLRYKLLNTKKERGI